MSKTILLITHVGSGHDLLVKSLISHPSIQEYKTDIIYDNINSLNQLSNNIHKCSDASAIWLETLLYNYRLNCKLLTDCKFIFFFGYPDQSMQKISLEYEINCGLRYYQFRLQGMLECLNRFPDSLVLDWEKLNKEGMKPIEEYLNIKTSLDVPKLDTKRIDIPLDIIKQADESYEKLNYAIKKILKAT